MARKTVLSQQGAGSPVTIPTPPGIASKFWSIEVESATGAVAGSNITTEFPAATAVNGSATEYCQRTLTGSAVAGSGVVIAESPGSPLRQAGIPIGRLSRFGWRIRLGPSAGTVRAWCGITSSPFASSANFFPDNPNVEAIAFRYNSGISANWQAVSFVNSVTSQSVDTGIQPSFLSTKLQQLDVVIGGTQGSPFLQYLIDGALVAQIGFGFVIPQALMRLFATADNKGVGGSITLSWSCISRYDF